MEDLQRDNAKKALINSESFQINLQPGKGDTGVPEDAEYTEDEIAFADGEGTQLDKEIDAAEGDIKDENS